MDFATRDRYRHAIERISKRTKKSELEIARTVLRMAETARDTNEDPAHAHVGYFLVGDGLYRLEPEVSCWLQVGERMRRAVIRHATVAYLGTLIVLTALVVGLLAFAVFAAGAGIPLTVLTAILTFLPASDLALSVLNWDITHSFEPQVLPKIDLSKGIPPEARTMVVVPVLFNDQATVDTLIEKLEVTYLANQDEHLHFALLGDFADAAEENLPGDKEILDAAKQGIEQLNGRYGSDQSIPFHLFHRRRQWCETEAKWIGWERKRGKLREFNQLLRGAGDTSSFHYRDRQLLSQIRYVITLDADTQLPRDAVCSSGPRYIR
jgi:hypothetical protein